MTVEAFTGPAGTGKTHHLIERVRELVSHHPLQSEQRLLALTFMHGARRRLQAKLNAVPEISRHVECLTIDSLALRLVKRWRSLARELELVPPDDEQFDRVCEQAAAILQHPLVVSWIGSRYPMILVDEAQDLGAPRLAIIQALASQLRVLVAFDEFQCLDARLRPNPLSGWIARACVPRELGFNHRTAIEPLLAAAREIRLSRPPDPAGAFRIFSAPSAPAAAAYLANAISWHGGNSIVVLSPAMTGGFAEQVVKRVATQACGRQGNGPYAISWEGTEQQTVDQLIAQLSDRRDGRLDEWITEFGRLPDTVYGRQLHAWIRRVFATCDATTVDRETVNRQLRLMVRRTRQFGREQAARITAMTVHQAKNREFDGVFVIWPYQVGGDAEHKRRLLYNAITRARLWCTVVVQGRGPPQTAPFV